MLWVIGPNVIHIPAAARYRHHAPPARLPARPSITDKTPSRLASLAARYAKHPYVLTLYPYEHFRQHHATLICASFRSLFYLYLLSLHWSATGRSTGLYSLSAGLQHLVAGIVISLQYISTLISRPHAGRYTDIWGPKSG